MLLPKIPDARTYDKTPQFQWIRLKNTGSYTIPAWSICEVTGPSLDLPTPDAAPFTGGVTYNVKRPSSYLAYQLASSGPLAIEPGKYGPGLCGSTLATNQFAAADMRGMPTRDSFDLLLSRGGPLVSTGSMAQGATLWHYDPAGMDGYFLCTTGETAAGALPGEDAECSAASLAGGTGKLLITDGGGFAELPEDVSFLNVLPTKIPDGTIVYVHRNANGAFHTIAAIKHPCEVFVGIAGKEIPPGGTGTIDRSDCGAGSGTPPTEVDDVQNNGGDAIGAGCRVLVVPCNDECDKEAIPLDCPGDCEYDGSVYTVGSLFSGMGETGVEINWQYQTENYKKGKLCSVTSGPVLTATIPTWYCCYPPVCDDIYYKEVECDSIYLAFYDTETLGADPAGGTLVGTAILIIDDVESNVTMFAFCESPPGSPLHIDSGVSVSCIIHDVNAADNGVQVAGASVENDDFACCPEAAAGESIVGYITAECYPDPEANRKNIVAKCSASNPGGTWVSNFPSRARRTAAKDPNCCEEVDDPDPGCCCPEDTDIGTYFEASSLHYHDDDSQFLAKDFKMTPGLDSNGDFLFNGGVIPHKDGAPTLDPADLDALGIDVSQLVTLPVWVKDEVGDLIRVHMLFQAEISCGPEGWSGFVRIANPENEPPTEDIPVNSENCCLPTMEISPSQILGGLIGYDGRTFTEPENPLLVTIGCPQELRDCEELPDDCEHVYTAGIVNAEAESANGCCCPTCINDEEGDQVKIGDATALGVTADFLCDVDAELEDGEVAKTFTASLVVDVPYTAGPDIEHTITVTMVCYGGELRGTVSTGIGAPVTYRFPCDIDTEERGDGGKLVEVPASHFQWFPDKSTDAVDVTFNITMGEECVPCPQWSYCGVLGTGIKTTPPAGKWKYAGYSNRKKACVYVSCARPEDVANDCDTLITPEWLEDGQFDGSIHLGMHRKPLSYWGLTVTDGAAAGVEEACCDCDPWTATYSVGNGGSDEFCCPEDGDNYKIKAIITHGYGTMNVWLTGENGYTWTGRVPVKLETSTLTTQENRTDKVEDEGNGQEADVTTILTIAAACDGGEWSGEIYLTKTSGYCTECTEVQELISTFGAVEGCFPGVSIPPERVRKGVECVWNNDLFPCCDPPDWNVTAGISIEFTCDPEPICERPPCNKIYTVGLIPTGRVMTDDVDAGCCGFEINKWIYTTVRGVDMEWDPALPPFPLPGPCELLGNVCIPVWCMGLIPPAPSIGPGCADRERAMLIDLSDNAFMPDGGLTFDLFHTGECTQNTGGVQIPFTPDDTRCGLAGIEIKSNMLYHMIGPAIFPNTYLLQDIDSPGDIDPPTYCVNGEQHYTLSAELDQVECVYCDEISAADFGDWTYAGYSQLKKQCVLVVCCVSEYNDITEECECDPPALPDPPAGWEYTGIKLEPLEWWGISGEGVGDTGECCDCCYTGGRPVIMDIVFSVGGLPDVVVELSFAGFAAGETQVIDWDAEGLSLDCDDPGDDVVYEPSVQVTLECGPDSHNVEGCWWLNLEEFENVVGGTGISYIPTLPCDNGEYDGPEFNIGACAVHWKATNLRLG